MCTYTGYYIHIYFPVLFAAGSSNEDTPEAMNTPSFQIFIFNIISNKINQGFLDKLLFLRFEQEAYNISIF